MNVERQLRKPDRAHAEGTGAAREAQSVPPGVDGESATQAADASPTRGPPLATHSPARRANPTGFAAALIERRKQVRRVPRADRGEALADLPSRGHRNLPRKWPYLILVMLTSLGAGYFVTGSGPGMVIESVLWLSITLVACVGPAGPLVARHRPPARLFATVLVVLLPLYLFGFGMIRWVSLGSLPWSVAVTSLVCVGALAAAYLRRQAEIVLAAQLALWSSAVTSAESGAGLVVLMLALVLALLVTREQLDEEKVEAEVLAAHERAETRARDILADYEETRQGWFWETDRRALLTYVSAPVARAIGKAPEELIGHPLVQLFAMGESGEGGERTLMFHLSARSSFTELPVRAAVEWEERWWLVSGRPIYDAYNNFVGFRGTGSDLTERKRSQEEVSRLANFDSLTGLANRFRMSQMLDKILRSQQESNRACAILLLDLDRFKQVNDTLGHPAGDILLRQVARRIEDAVGKQGQVGRLGGDEFQIIVPGHQGREVLNGLGLEIISSLSQPYTIERQRVVIGASLGISLAPVDGRTSEELIRKADLALYAAKDGGRGRLQFYADDLHAAAEARLQLEEDLRAALASGDLQMFYQPIVSTSTERITGFEALLRWYHPVKGWIPPNRFVAIAEDAGLITHLDAWALRTACHEVAQWPEDVRVAVNVSPQQFANPQLPALVARAIAEAGIAADQLELEVTESVFLSDATGSEAMFAALKRIGVRLVLDDFGTGYSSLGYLRKAPLDRIKIDQSFVRGATEEGSRNSALICSIASLAQSLGMETTAEGVETFDELDLVRQLGCSHVQGYIYDRPLDPAVALQRLASGPSALAQGPRSSRAPRRAMLRKVLLDHNGNLYTGKIRNISTTGAMIEGLWNVPLGTVFKVQISLGHMVTCTTRWSQEDRIGVEFADPLQRDASGQITALQAASPKPIVRNLESEPS